MLRLLLWVGIGYVLFTALLWAMQGNMLYQPNVGGSADATPSDIGLEWESVALETDDGVNLDAWWIPNEATDGVLLFFHGNAGNISHRLHSIEHFNRLGLSVLIIDYRGYGNSEGSPSEEGTALDARAAWRWLVDERNLEPQHITVFGRSLGSAVAAELAREVSPGGVILESSFRSVPDMAQRLYPFLPARWLARFDYATEDYVRGIRAPVLVIHSPDDEIIPFAEGKAVYEAANHPKKMLEIGGGHNTGFLEYEDRYLDGIGSFLREHGLAKTTP